MACKTITACYGVAVLLIVIAYGYPISRCPVCASFMVHPVMGCCLSD